MVVSFRSLNLFIFTLVTAVSGSNAFATPASSSSSSSSGTTPPALVERSYKAECAVVQSWDKVRQAISYQIQKGYNEAGFKGKVFLGHSNLVRSGAAKSYKSTEIVLNGGSVSGNNFSFTDSYLKIVNEPCTLSGPIAVTFRGKDKTGKPLNTTYPFNIKVDGIFRIP